MKATDCTGWFSLGAFASFLATTVAYVAYAQETPTPDDLLSLPPIEEVNSTGLPGEEGLLDLPMAPASAPVPGQLPVTPLQGVPSPVAGQPPMTLPQDASAQMTEQPLPQDTTQAEPDAQATINALLPNPLDIVSDTSDTGFKPSYGSWQYSIMYPSTEMTNLKNILALYERKGFIVDQATPEQQAQQQEMPPTVEEIYQKLQEQPLPANLVYPSFKLRSIIYRNANDWSVWLNNRHITNETNKTENEIVVVQINKNFAEFAWIPSNAELLSAILQIRLLPEGSRPPTSETPSHRKSTISQSSGWLDRNTSVVHFILRPNQVFYAETFEVFEGTPNMLASSIDRAIQLETQPNAAPVATGEDPTQIIKDLQKQLEAAERGKAAPQPNADGTEPTLENQAEEFIKQKQNPKSQMMRTLGLGK